MKIEVNNPAVNLVQTNAATKKVSTGNVAEVESSTIDRTTFHTGSGSVQALTNLAMQHPEVRQDKVDALSQAVKNGDYKVDASKIASAIAAQD